MNIIHHMHIGIFPQQLYNAIMKISHNFSYIKLLNIRTDIPLVFPQKYLIYWRFIRTDLSRNYSYDTLSLFSTLRVYQYPPYTHSSMVQSYLIIPLTTERYSAYYQHSHPWTSAQRAKDRLSQLVGTHSQTLLIWSEGCAMKEKRALAKRRPWLERRPPWDRGSRSRWRH